jgi:acetyl-CoA synthase
MSRIIAGAALRGANKMMERAEQTLARTIEEKGKDHEVAYPNTAYYLPIMYMFLGQKVEKLGDLEESLQEGRKLLKDPPTDDLWLPYLGDTLDAGVSTLLAEETIEALKYCNGPSPADGI